MDAWKKRAAFTIFLIVAVPVGLFFGFNFFASSGRVAIADMENVGPARLVFDRPMDDISSFDVWNSLINEEILVNVSSVGDYDELRGEFGYIMGELGRDGMTLRIWVNCSAWKGFIHSVRVDCVVDRASFLFWRKYDSLERSVRATLMNYNLTERRLEAEWNILENETAIHIAFYAIFLDDPDKRENFPDHFVKFSATITYHNGTAYRKAIVPLIIKVTDEVGDSFEEAWLIEAGERLGALSGADPHDFYTINLKKGQKVTITLIPPQNADFNLHLYNSQYKEIANSTKGLNQPETISYTVEETGIYYIKVDWLAWNGIYKLKIQVED